MGALMKWLHSEPREGRTPAPDLRSVEELRQRSLDAIADCTRPHAERIRSQLARAPTAQQLWLARCDIYQAVAHQHCEAEAMRRINDLLPVFEGWLPPSALTPL
jgi:hypothetical protein